MAKVGEQIKNEKAREDARAKARAHAKKTGTAAPPPGMVYEKV